MGKDIVLKSIRKRMPLTGDRTAERNKGVLYV